MSKTKTCNGCYAAITGSHPLSGIPCGCELGYKNEKGLPLEKCPKPRSWRQLNKEKIVN